MKEYKLEVGVLNNCPFCGNPVRRIGSTKNQWAVRCNGNWPEDHNCRAYGPRRSTEEEAIAAWNERGKT